MYFKKLIISILFSVLFFGFTVQAAPPKDLGKGVSPVDVAKQSSKVQNLANAIFQSGQANVAILQSLSNEDRQSFILSKDAEFRLLDKQQRGLNIAEKVAFFELMRSKYSDSTELSSREIAFRQASRKAASEGIFLGDLTDSEIKDYLEPFNTGDSSIFIQSSCPFLVFNRPIYASQPPYAVNYYFPYTHRRVINEVGEDPCDYELLFGVSRNNIWGTTASARALLSALFGFNGTLAKRTAGGDRVIFGEFRTWIYYGNNAGAELAREMYIW